MFDAAFTISSTSSCTGSSLIVKVPQMTCSNQFRVVWLTWDLKMSLNPEGLKKVKRRARSTSNQMRMYPKRKKLSKLRYLSPN